MLRRGERSSQSNGRRRPGPHDVSELAHSESVSPLSRISGIERVGGKILRELKAEFFETVDQLNGSKRTLKWFPFRSDALAQPVIDGELPRGEHLGRQGIIKDHATPSSCGCGDKAERRENRRPSEIGHNSQPGKQGSRRGVKSRRSQNLRQRLMLEIYRDKCDFGAGIVMSACRRSSCFQAWVAG